MASLGVADHDVANLDSRVGAVQPASVGFRPVAGCRSKAVTWAAEPGWAVGPGAGEVPGGSVRAAAGRPEP